jgi:superfamily II DNA or RNA helicase
MGMYPLLLDETCCFLAVDFDKASWREDVKAFRDACTRWEIPVALERSRSGNGGHVWFFFQQPVPAKLARILGSFLLTETMEMNPGIGLDSYDRLFPNQDTLPTGGFGNLIALPLQKQARGCCNSVFLDEHLNPHADQWAFLSAIRKVDLCKIETVAREAERRGKTTGVRSVLTLQDEDTDPWLAPPSRQRQESPITEPLPESIELVICDQVYIAKENLLPQIRNRLIRLAAFQNPDFYKAQAMRLSVHDKPRIIQCAEDLPGHIALPRGCLEEAQALLRNLNIKPIVRDERVGGKPLDVTFHGALRPDQQVAAAAMAAHETGVLSATTAFGKTVLAAWLIARRGVNTLVLVHRQQLLDQWIERLSTFLGLPEKEIGRIGGGRKKITGTLDVALIQSLVRKRVVNDLVAQYGHLVIDECHHISAQSFELVARRAKARYVTGLSATITRQDGHHPIIYMQCGPMRYQVNAKQQAATRPFSHCVFVRPTNFRSLNPPCPDQRAEFNQLYRELIVDAGRNQLICTDIVSAANEGHAVLVLTERTEHLQQMSDILAPQTLRVVSLQGGMGRKEIALAMERLASTPADAGFILLATGKFIGEGFDEPRLDTLFLALPVSWRGTIAQYAGRLHRLHAGKKEVRIYDYADLNVPMFARMFDKRCASYESIGYTVLLPGNAVPGWPAEVPLPIDPEWKQDYAASVRRLIQDGVDMPLANLFVHAAVKPVPQVIGSAHARSATEAFLFRRLETLPQTAGRFLLRSIFEKIARPGWFTAKLP